MWTLLFLKIAKKVVFYCKKLFEKSQKINSF